MADETATLYAKIGAGLAAAWAAWRGAKRVLAARVEDQGGDIETLRRDYESLQAEVAELKRKSNERLDRMEFELAEARKDITETQIKSESATRHFTIIERALRELRALFEAQPLRELPRD